LPGTGFVIAVKLYNDLVRSLYFKLVPLTIHLWANRWMGIIQPGCIGFQQGSLNGRVLQVKRHGTQEDHHQGLYDAPGIYGTARFPLFDDTDAGDHGKPGQTEPREVFFQGVISAGKDHQAKWKDILFL